jgi:hypothetical protein
MKYTLATIVVLASLFQPFAQAKVNEGIYTIKSHSGVVWGIEHLTGEQRVVLVPPEGKLTEYWRISPTGKDSKDYFIQNVGTQGMVACWSKNQHKCEAKGNDAQPFTVRILYRPDAFGTVEQFNSMVFHPSDSAIRAVRSKSGRDLGAYAGQPDEKTYFFLTKVQNEGESLYFAMNLNL